MIRDNDRTRGFGVEFKFNTGRAIGYFYDHPYALVGSRRPLISALEQFFKPNIFDEWPKPDKSACVTNYRDVVLSRISKWDREINIEGVQIECLMVIKYVSLVVPYNYEFHFRVAV